MPTYELPRAEAVGKKIYARINSIKKKDAESEAKKETLQAGKNYLDAGTAIENFLETYMAEARAKSQLEEKLTKQVGEKNLKTQAIVEPDTDFLAKLKLYQDNFLRTRLALDQKLTNLENHKTTEELVTEVIDINKHIARYYKLQTAFFTGGTVARLGIFNRAETNKEMELEDRLVKMIVSIEHKETDKSKPQKKVLQKALDIIKGQQFTVEQLGELVGLLDEYIPQTRSAKLSPTVNLIGEVIIYIEQNLPLSSQAQQS